MERIIPLGVVLLALALPDAAFAARTHIRPSEMRPTAIRHAVNECQRRAYVRIRGVPMKLYQCSFVHVVCRWHPPLAPSIGYCDLHIRISPARPSFLVDIECYKRLFFRRYRPGRATPVNPRSSWRCYEAGTGQPAMRRWQAAILVASGATKE